MLIATIRLLGNDVKHMKATHEALVERMKVLEVMIHNTRVDMITNPPLSNQTPTPDLCATIVEPTNVNPPLYDKTPTSDLTATTLEPPFDNHLLSAYPNTISSPSFSVYTTCNDSSNSSHSKIPHESEPITSNYLIVCTLPSQPPVKPSKLDLTLDDISLPILTWLAPSHDGKEEKKE